MSAKAVTWGNNLRVEMIRLDRCKPNPWNPNRMTEVMFEKERLSIRTYGFVEPLKVRVLEDQGSLHLYEIIDGEHRWRAAQLEGMQEVPAVILGIMDDAKAKKLTIIANELRGSPEPVLMAALVKDLSESISLEDLSAALPFTEVELSSYIKSTEAFNWDEVEKTLPDAPAREPTAQDLGAERRFQIGTVKGNVPLKLHDELMAEFNRSARLVGSSNPEMVMRDWVDRLKATASAVDAEIAKQPAQAPASSRRKAGSK